MPHPRSDFINLWKHARAGDEVKVQEQIEECEAVARNLVNLKHHRKGTTPLMEAAGGRRHEPVVATLIAAGAIVNGIDETNIKNTALHYAAMTNRDSLTTETLLEAGADVFALNRKGLTPLDIARQNNRKAVGAVLLKHMKVHSGWLYIRGQYHWKKRWGVVVACNKQRTSTELCLYRRQGSLRPLVVMLIDEAAQMAQFPSTDSYSWLQRDNAFVFDKPVMCLRFKKDKFTRSPICKKMISLGKVETVQYVFAADSVNNLAQWRHVLQRTNFLRGNQSSLHRSSLLETQNGELYYWPHEIVENLRSSILNEQEMQHEQDNDPLYQRLRATFDQRRPIPDSDTVKDSAVGPMQMPTEPVVHEDELVDEELHQKPLSLAIETMTLENQDDPTQSSNYTQHSNVDGQQTTSHVDVVSASDLEFKFGPDIRVRTENKSQDLEPPQNAVHGRREYERGNEDHPNQQDRQSQPFKSPEQPEHQSDLNDSVTNNWNV